MKWHKKKKFSFKSYICKNKQEKRLLRILSLCCMIATCTLLFVGYHAGVPLKKNGINETAVKVTPKIESQEYDQEKADEEAKKQSLTIARSYQALYRQADKTASTHDRHQKRLSQETIDQIEADLIKEGYPVINSDKKYPAYLENADGLKTFWQLVTAGKDGNQAILTLTPTGGLEYAFFQYIRGEKYCTVIHVDWNAQNDPVITSTDYMEVLDWQLSESGTFYYEFYYPDWTSDTYVAIRLQPMDKHLYDLTEKYLLKIGYQSNNMFLCDWTSKDYGELVFNDLFEYFYRIKNNAFFTISDAQRIQEPFLHTDIPSWLFEETLLPYFDISAEALRKRSDYDAAHKSYPWQEVCCKNVEYYPVVEPEVISYEENKEGTFTLTVQVRCNSYKTDCLFAHEVVIRPLEEGGYHYISNKVIYKSDLPQPPNEPRFTFTP